MILAYHAIFTAYGFWLPNDPRGSGSDFIRSWDLLRYGPATKVRTRHSVADTPHDVARRLAAKEALKFPPVQFTGEQALAIGMGIRSAMKSGAYSIHACAIMPDHVHVVIARHERNVKRIVGHMKADATRELKARRMHPFTQFARDGEIPTVWTHRAWVVYLDSAEAVHSAIQYADSNPMKEGLPPQRWSFVTPFIPPI